MDPTLTLQDYAADAKASGDWLRSLSNIPITWIDNIYIRPADGTVANNTSYVATDWIEVESIRKEYYFKLTVFQNIATFAIYDELKNLIRSSAVASSSLIATEGTVVVTEPNAKYIRFSAHKHSEKIIRSGSVYNDEWIMPDKTVTIPKVNDDFLIRDENSNYIDYTKVQTGKYINASGKTQSSTNVNATDFIPITSGATYYYTNVHNTYYAFYDLSKQLISSYSTLGNLSGGSFTPPAGTAFGRFTILTPNYNNQNAWISPYNKQPISYRHTFNPENISVYADGQNSVNPCNYNGDEICAFTKCLCIGDSLTSGTFNYLDGGTTNNFIVFDKYSYPRNLERLTNMEVTNMGAGGYSSAEWYAAYQNTDLSGYDIAIIQLGVNDQIRYGGFGNTSKTAFSSIFAKLKNENNHIKIFVANIIPATSYSSSTYLQFSADLLTWLQAQNALDPDIIPLDIQQYGHTRDLVAYNCGHLSAFGYYRLAKDYKAYISKYMIDNPSLFREIQFIGTNYQYEA